MNVLLFIENYYNAKLFIKLSIDQSIKINGQNINFLFVGRVYRNSGHHGDKVIFFVYTLESRNCSIFIILYSCEQHCESHYIQNCEFNVIPCENIQTQPSLT